MGIFWNWLSRSCMEYTFNFGFGGYIYVAYSFFHSRVLDSHPNGGLASNKFLQPTVLTPFLSRQENFHHLKKTN